MTNALKELQKTVSCDIKRDFTSAMMKFNETSPQVKPCHVFGVSKGVRNNLLFQDEETVIFPSGNHCVSYNIPQRRTEFIHAAEGHMGMQALALSPDRRYLAVSECGTITVFDLNGGKCTEMQVLTGGDRNVKEFVCMAFSADSKYLLGQAGGPTWRLFYWQWAEKELIASVRATKNGLIKQVSFNPEDDKQVCVSGKGVFRIFELKEDSLKQAHSFRKEIDDVLCHTWMSGDSIVAGTKAGQLLMLKSGCLHELDNPYESNGNKLDSSSSLSSLTSVSAIVRHSKGFACSAGLGLVCLYEETEEKDYRKTRTIKIPVDPDSKQLLQAITTMCVSPSGKTLAISTDQGQLYHISFRSSEISMKEKDKFKFLSHSFHSGSITGLSVCVTKPIMATCSKDCTVHIWNYKTKTLELFKEFDNEPICISIHPDGLSILVGFSTEVWLMGLTSDDMHTLREFPINNCTECVFNHSGDMFAVITDEMIHTVNVSRGEKKELSGHFKTVQSVKWSDDDTHLVSCGMDGLVYIWDIVTGTHTTCNQKRPCYTDVTFSPNSRSVIAVDSNKIHEISGGRVLYEMASDDVEYTPVSVTRSDRRVFVGTAAGTVRVFDYPFEKEMTWTEHQAHSGPITKMVVTPGDQYLLTASEDGSLFIWSIIDQNGQTLEMASDIDCTEKVLCSKKFLNEKDEKINELMWHIEWLEARPEFTKRVKDMNFQKKMGSSIENGLQQTEYVKEQIQVRGAAWDDQTLSYETMLTELKEQLAQKCRDQRDSLNMTFYAKIEHKREWKQKFQLCQGDFEMKLKQLEERHLCATENKKQAHKTKLQELQVTLEQEIKDSEERLKNLKDLTEHEIMDLCYDYDLELEVEKEIRQRLQCYKKNMKSRMLTYSCMEGEIHHQSSGISKLEKDIQDWREQSQNVTKNIKRVTKKIKKQSKTRVMKERSIEELNKIIDDLELSLEKKEQEIVQLLLNCKQFEEQMKREKERKRLENECLVKELEENKEMFKKICSKVKGRKQNKREVIADLKRQLQSEDKSLQTEKLRGMDANILVQRMKSDLHNSSSFIQEPEKLRKNFIAIHKRHINKTDVETDVDTEVVQEQTRHTEQMRKVWDSQTSRQTKELKTEKTNYYKMVTENTSLIKELQDQQLKNRIVLQSHEEKNIEYDKTGLPAILAAKRKRRGPAIALQKPMSSVKLPPISP